MTRLRAVDLPGARDSLIAALGELLPRLDDESADLSRAHARAARDAELWWVAPAMTQLALDASRSLPEWRPAQAAPAQTGLLYWAGPLPVVPYDGARRSCWPVGPLGVPSPPQAPVRGILWRTVAGRIELHALIAPTDLPAEVWQIPVGRLVQSTGVLLGDVVTSRPQITAAGDLIPGIDSSWVDSLIALTGATWLLMREPDVADNRTPTAPARSRRTRTPRRVPASVTTIRLRAAARRAGDPEDLEETASSPAGDAPRWRLATRHVVRGHWRHYRVGPGGAERQLRWIDAHLRGPADAPVQHTEHVHTWGSTAQTPTTEDQARD